MSIVCMGWVFNHSEAKLGDRLVLLALADFANEDGTGAWPSIKTLSDKARLSERQVKRCLANLKDAGRIIETGASSYGTRVWQVVMVEPGKEGDAGEGGGDILSKNVHDLSPDPSFNPLTSTTPPIDPPRNAIARREAGIVTRKGWTVDRKPVSEPEETIARDVLTRWNHRTGQALASQEWLGKIVMRHREHPEYSADDHEAIIAAALEAPWWKGHASPAVVYGNGAVFEQAVETAKAKARGQPQGKQPMRYGRGLTTKQILDMTRGKT